MKVFSVRASASTEYTLTAVKRASVSHTLS